MAFSSQVSRLAREAPRPKLAEEDYKDTEEEEKDKKEKKGCVLAFS